MSSSRKILKNIKAAKEEKNQELERQKQRDPNHGYIIKIADKLFEMFSLENYSLDKFVKDFEERLNAYHKEFNSAYDPKNKIENKKQKNKFLIQEIFKNIILNANCKNKNGDNLLKIISKHYDPILRFYLFNFIYQYKLGEDHYEMFTSDALICSIVFNQPCEIFPDLIKTFSADYFSKLNPEYNSHRRLLLLAAAYNNLSMANYLLKANINPNDEVLPEKDNWDISHRYPLHAAAEAGHAAMVELLLQNKAEVDLFEDKQTALHLAVTNNHADVVRCLLKYNANKNLRTKNLEKYTPFYLAAQFGFVEVAKILWEHGADISKTEKLCGFSPIEIATLEGHSAFVEFYLVIDPNLEKAHKNALQLCIAAAENGHVALCQLWLTKSGHHFTNIFEYDANILFTIVKKDFPAVLQLFIEQGVNLNSYDVNGLTPLHHAATKGHLQITQMLLNAGANPALETKPLDGEKTSTAAGLAATPEIRLLIMESLKNPKPSQQHCEEFTIPMSYV